MAENMEYMRADGVKLEIKFVSPPDRGPRCGNCRFYSASHERKDGGEWREVPHGQCYRYPPHALTTDRREFAFWPKVLSDNWCGEHEPREGDS